MRRLLLISGIAGLAFAAPSSAQTPGPLVFADDRLAAEALLALAGHESALRWGIAVSVDAGVVILEGRVPYASDRDAVEAALGGVLGARAIVDRIETDPAYGAFGPSRRDDRTVEWEARRALWTSPRFEGLSVVCRAGEVVLRGEVQGWDGLREAAEAVLRVGGIRKLRSEVTVESARAGC